MEGPTRIEDGKAAPLNRGWELDAAGFSLGCGLSSSVGLGVIPFYFDNVWTPGLSRRSSNPPTGAFNAILQKLSPVSVSSLMVPPAAVQHVLTVPPASVHRL